MLQGTLDPNQVDSIIEEGRALIQGGNAKEAVECFVRAAEADPTNPKVWNDLGVALFISDQIQPAIEAFESAIRYDACFPDAYINLATAASKTGNSALVQTTLEAAKASIPGNVEIDAVYSDLLGSAPAPTIQTSTPVQATPAPVAAPPQMESAGTVADPVEAHVMRGRAFIANGQAAEASQEFLKALELDPACAPAWNDLGVAMFKNDEPAGAFEAFQTCLSHDASYADAAINMTAVAAKIGQEAGAITALEGVLAIDPTNAEVRDALGRIQTETKTDEVERQTRALDLMNLGREKLAESEYAEAGRKFLEATEVAPGFAPPWNDLGVALFLEDHNDLSFQAFETALQLAPGFVDAALNLTKCAKRIGKLPEAEAWLKGTLKKNPDDRELTEALANLYAPEPIAQPAPAAAQPAPIAAPPVVQPETFSPNPMAALEQRAFDEAVERLEDQLMKGRQQLMAGEIQQACETFLDAIEMDMTCAISWNDLGVALHHGGNHESAIEAFETAMMHDPTMSDAPINMAMSLKKLNQVDAALNVLQTAMIRCPEDADVKAAYDAMNQSNPSAKVNTIVAQSSNHWSTELRGRSFLAIDVNANRAANNVQLARENGATAANIHTPTEVRDGLIGGSVSEMSDVVYCGEVLERVPNPAQTLGILRQIATDRVIVTTRCVPATIQTDAGSIQFTDNSACFVPAAGDVAKSILETFEANQGRDVEFINGTAVEGGWLLGTNDEPSAVWWVWTDNFVQKMIESAGFSIVQARETAQAGVKSFVCQVA